MNNKFTDEHLDQIAKNLLNDFSFDNEKLDEIADSPVIWRNIKREINRRKPEQNKGWMQMWFRQIFAFSAFAVLAICVGISLVWFLNSSKIEDVAAVDLPKFVEPKAVDKVEVSPMIEQPMVVSSPRKVVVGTKTLPAKIVQTKIVTPKVEPKIITVTQPKLSQKQTPKSVETKQQNAEEVKTEFISLSYMPTPESGQIVRVKVPRAMMVSLGVSNNVSKNAEMVNAEVILGDDGTSRAIRFISTNNR
jgi:hypothetical protein